MPLVTLVQSPMTGWNQVLKRVLDLAGAILALILFSPLMLLIAFLVKITSPGPILYRQQRMGLDGKTFFTLKFRSMRQDAEKQTGAVWATENDTGVIFRGPDRSGLFFCILAHRPEFEREKRFPIEAHPLLSVKNWTGRGDFDQEGNQQHER